MNSFVVDAPAVAELTRALRTAASAIADITTPPGHPGPGPTAAFDAALARAVERANERGVMLREEALRLADVMDLTVEAATAVDTASARRLGAMLP